MNNKNRCENCGQFLGENHKCPKTPYYLGKHLSQNTKDKIRFKKLNKKQYHCRRKDIDLQKDKIITDYLNDNKIGVRTLSRKYKCSRECIERLLKENKIKLKTEGEVAKGRKTWFNYLKKEDPRMKIILEKKALAYLFGRRNWNYKLTKETDERVKNNAKAIKEVRRFWSVPVKDTYIEIKIQGFLKELGIEFFTHNYIKITNAYQCDILIPIQKGIEQETIIECDGDFFHCNPEKYSEDFVRFPNGSDKRKAKDIWERDKIRVKQLEEKGYKIIRLWESEIRVININKFKERIFT
jgi:G:T-mismatch repair DNA endonuclease (very short patch repair protein)